MLSYIAHRFLYMIATLAMVSVVGFIIIDLPPGSYLEFYVAQREASGTTTSEAEMETLKKQYGLGEPSYVQYWKWITGFVQGDFGRSFLYNADVGDLIWARIGFTVLLSTLSLFLTWLVAIPLGIYSATHQYSLADHFFTSVGLAGISIPNFMLALLLMVGASHFMNLDVSGLFSQTYIDAPWSWAKLVDLLKHIWVPLIVITMGGTASLMRMMRGNLLDIIHMQYIQAARARGLRERRVIVKYAVRNAIHPLIMLLGTSFPGIISGAMVISIVLSLPTTGPLYFNALQQKDMYLAVTFLMFLAIMLVVGNFLADMLLAWIDPRIRYD